MAIGANLFTRAAVVLTAGLLWAATAASAHRMPEVHITAETIDVEGEAMTGLTFRLMAADVLALLGADRDLSTDLKDWRVLQQAGERVLAGISTEGGEPNFLGGEVDGNYVFLYASGPKTLDVTDARVLSSAFDAWTNVYEDERSDVPTRMFTQWGEQGSQHGYHHHRH
jgi:hypothetical protein